MKFLSSKIRVLERRIMKKQNDNNKGDIKITPSF